MTDGVRQTRVVPQRILDRRMLRPADAATYCGLPTEQFLIICPVRPVKMPDGKKLFDKHDLDQWIEARISK